ncbi:hypothetical protein D3C87_1757110 [compost metagenome]
MVIDQGQVQFQIRVIGEEHRMNPRHQQSPEVAGHADPQVTARAAGVAQRIGRVIDGLQQRRDTLEKCLPLGREAEHPRGAAKQLGIQLRFEPGDAFGNRRRRGPGIARRGTERPGFHRADEGNQAG